MNFTKDFNEFLRNTLLEKFEEFIDYFELLFDKNYLMQQE